MLKPIATAVAFATLATTAVAQTNAIDKAIARAEQRVAVDHCKLEALRAGVRGTSSPEYFRAMFECLSRRAAD